MELNKISDGLLTNMLSKNVLLPGESKKELCKIRDLLIKDLNPVGALEEIILSDIIISTWKVQRLYKFETKILRDQQNERSQNYKNDSQWHTLQKQAGKKVKRFRSTVKQIKYTQSLEEIQKHISILKADLLKTIAELKSIQGKRLEK